MWTSRLRLHCHRYALPVVSDEAVLEGLEGVEESISPASIAQGGCPPLLHVSDGRVVECVHGTMAPARLVHATPPPFQSTRRGVIGRRGAVARRVRAGGKRPLWTVCGVVVVAASLVLVCFVCVVESKAQHIA